MGTVSGQGTESVPYPTICQCGSAKGYHRPEDQRDHEYTPRYEPGAFREGYTRGIAEARTTLFAEVRRGVEGLVPEMVNHTLLRPDPKWEDLVTRDAVLRLLDKIEREGGKPDSQSFRYAGRRSGPTYGRPPSPPEGE